jgi:hypothetical protein
MEDVLSVLRQASAPLGPMGAEWLARQELDVQRIRPLTSFPHALLAPATQSGTAASCCCRICTDGAARTVLASRSNDGELASRFVRGFGLETVRGSSSRVGAAKPS